MAPPRQRPAAAANLDDSRSEASSTRERQAGAKGRKAAAAAKESNKPTSFPASSDPAHRTANADSNNNNPSISWSTMPLSVLHEYRHVYNLPSPSAYSSQINSINLSQGIGLLSPTAIAARRAHKASSSPTTTTTTTNLAGKKSKPTADTDAQSTTSSTKRGGGESKDNPPYSRATSVNPPASTTSNSIETRKNVKKSGGGGGLDLHRVSSITPAQGRVSKDHLASAVRKHFNNTAISEQDAIARFLYKVNEERKGREFRLRFQP